MSEIEHVPTHKIKVTPEILARACEKNTRHCMIAEAVREQIPNATNISVDLMTVRFTDQETERRYTYPTPRSAQDGLIRFDKGMAIQPFGVHLKNGHAVSMQRRGRAMHNLGPRKVTTTKTASGGIESQTVGGHSPPKLKPKHPSHNSVRAFGLEGFTKEWEYKGAK